MNELHIHLHHEPQCLPGETVEGEVRWSLDVDPGIAELRLLWFTRGKGTEDRQVVEAIPFDRPQRSESRPFRFVLPNAPYSFSGKLISLIWIVELTIDPGGLAEAIEITVSPTGSELVLPEIEKIR